MLLCFPVLSLPSFLLLTCGRYQLGISANAQMTGPSYLTLAWLTRLRTAWRSCVRVMAWESTSRALVSSVSVPYPCTGKPPYTSHKYQLERLSFPPRNVPPIRVRFVTHTHTHVCCFYSFQRFCLPPVRRSVGRCCKSSSPSRVQSDLSYPAYFPPTHTGITGLSNPLHIKSNYQTPQVSRPRSTYPPAIGLGVAHFRLHQQPFLSLSLFRQQPHSLSPLFLRPIEPPSVGH